MRAISYNRELRLANEQMLMLFGNIVIDKNLITSAEKLKGCKKRVYVVKAVFAQESKVFKSLQNPKQSELVLPLVSISREGLIARDDARVANSNYQAVAGHNAATMPGINKLGNVDPRDPYYDSFTPQPVTLKYRVTFYTRDPNEMDIFMGNVAIAFNKDVWVRTPHPKIEGLALEHQIIWDGQFQTTWESDRLKPEDIDIMTCSTTFDYKTEFFGGTNLLTDSTKGIVEKIVFDTNVPGDKSPYDAFTPGCDNVTAGFFCVPLTKSFEEFEEMLNGELLEKPDGDYMSFSVYNGIFNEAILNCDIDKMKEAVSLGANIYKNSYWPLAYAVTNNDRGSYDEIISYLKELGALDDMNKSASDEIHIADLDDHDIPDELLNHEVPVDDSKRATEIEDVNSPTNKFTIAKDGTVDVKKERDVPSKRIQPSPKVFPRPSTATGHQTSEQSR